MTGDDFGAGVGSGNGGKGWAIGDRTGAGGVVIPNAGCIPVARNRSCKVIGRVEVGARDVRP